MNISEREKNKFHIIDIKGKINRLKDSVNLKSAFNELLVKGIRNIALNLKNVTYLDSGALNVIIYTFNSLAKEKGTLVLIAPNEYVRDVLEVVGLNKIVKIYSTEEDFENDKETG
jgi:stage II sporulation protein AA (anti-sigma F factor antagonist)